MNLGVGVVVCMKVWHTVAADLIAGTRRRDIASNLHPTLISAYFERWMLKPHFAPRLPPSCDADVHFDRSAWVFFRPAAPSTRSEYGGLHAREFRPPFWHTRRAFAQEDAGSVEGPKAQGQGWSSRHGGTGREDYSPP